MADLSFLQPMSALIGAGFNVMMQDKTYSMQKDLMNLQNKFNVNMWERNNQWNSPANQVSLLRQAGLNPSMLMGSPATSSPVTSADPSAPSPTNLGLGEAMMQGITNMFQMRKLEAETRKTEADIAKTEAETAGLEWDNNHKDQNFEKNMEQFDAVISNYKAQTHFTTTQDEWYGKTAEKQNAKLDEEINILKENLRWIPQLNQANLDKVYEDIKGIQSTIQLQAKEGRHVDIQSEIDSFYSDLANRGVDPKANGVDKFINMILKDPTETIDLAVGIISALLGKLKGDVTVPPPKPLSPKGNINPKKTGPSQTHTVPSHAPLAEVSSYLQDMYARSVYDQFTRTFKNHKNANMYG